MIVLVGLLARGVSEIYNFSHEKSQGKSLDSRRRIPLVLGMAHFLRAYLSFVSALLLVLSCPQKLSFVGC
ncbi:MAG TPA: hypothetical protein VF719_05100, partial [Abditibacteriaceae bacterium]